MCVESEYKEENFVRAIRQTTTTRIIAHLLLPQIKALLNLPEQPELHPLRDQGWSNFTIRVSYPGRAQHYILRLTERRTSRTLDSSRSISHFEKERMIMERMAEHSFIPKMIPPGTGCVHLPVPGRGMVEYAYILQTYLPFVAAREKSRIHDRARILEQLGAILRIVHATSLQGFGADFDESNNRFSFPTFADLIQSNLDRLENSPISAGMKQWLQNRVEQLLDISPASNLFHRDLLGNWGNFLIDENETVRGIIDWEFAGAGPAFHFEIASFLYVLSRDGCTPERQDHDLRAVLRGYGLSFVEYQESYQRDIETLVLLNSVSAIMKHADLERCGGIAKEPWRKLFAERANQMCANSYTSDTIVARAPRRAPATAKRLSHIGQLRRLRIKPMLKGAKGF